MLKDKYLTQSAPDIRRKLHKIIQNPRITLDEMLTTATTVFYNHDQVLEAQTQEKQRRS